MAVGAHTQVVIEPGRMRASDADRDAVLERLRHAHGEGRLDGDELTERVDAAVTARTVGQLAELIADLPPAPVGLEARRPADAGGHSRGADLFTRAAFTPAQLGAIAIAIAVVCVNVWVLSTFTAGSAFLWAASVFWVFLLLRRHRRRRSPQPPDRR